MYSHLLVPLDGSDITLGLARIAIDYARSTKARITFFHAARDFGATDEGALQRVIDPDAFDHHSQDESQRIVSPAVKAAHEAGVAAQGYWKISSSVSTAILSAAANYDCDLIMIASHGTRGLNRLLLGSQTSKVVSESTLPVLVVRVPH